MLLLDTHVLVWLDEGSRRLGARALEKTNQALAEGELSVSAVSFWEVGMLVSKGRLEVNMDLYAWRLELLQNGLREIPLDGAIALRSAHLEDFHGDPADRIIVATAMVYSATVVTADQKILGWDKGLRKLDATV